MKNVSALITVLAMVGCGCGCPVNIEPDPSGSGGNGGSGGSVGNGGNGGSGECCNGNGARLTRQYLVGDDGSKMETPIWYDKQFDIKCSFQSMPNNVGSYCVPPHDTGNTYFDAQCLIPVYVQQVLDNSNLECLKLPTHIRFGVSETNWNVKCGQPINTFAIHKVDQTKFLGTYKVWWEKQAGGACVIRDHLVPSNNSVAVWEAPKVGALDDFVKAVEGVGF